MFSISAKPFKNWCLFLTLSAVILSLILIVQVSLARGYLTDDLIAVDDVYSATEDTVLYVVENGLLANDEAMGGVALAVVGNTLPLSGTLTVNPDGTLTYTPTLNFNGIDWFTYTASDGVITDTADVTITVQPVNDAPIAGEDMYTAAEDTPMYMTMSDYALFYNDSDVDGDPLVLESHTNPNHGALEIYGDGAFIYTPTLNYFGLDGFAYSISDGALTDSATVTITVNSINDPPMAMGDMYTVHAGMTLTVAAPGVLGNDYDIDAEELAVSVATPVSSGALILHSDGSFVYVPVPGFLGYAAFNYAINDGVMLSDPIIATIEVLSREHLLFLPMVSSSILKEH